MEKQIGKSLWLPAILIPVGTLIVLGISYMLYYGYYLAIDAIFNARNVQGPPLIPTGWIRLSFAIILFILGIVIWRTKWPELLKVILLTAPLAMLIITGILTYYSKLPLAVAIASVFIAGSLLLVYRAKKPWLYYYAIVMASIAGFYYAWPR